MITGTEVLGPSVISLSERLMAAQETGVPILARRHTVTHCDAHFQRLASRACHGTVLLAPVPCLRITSGSVPSSTTAPLGPAAACGPAPDELTCREMPFRARLSRPLQGAKSPPQVPPSARLSRGPAPPGSQVGHPHPPDKSVPARIAAAPRSKPWRGWKMCSSPGGALKLLAKGRVASTVIVPTVPSQISYGAILTVSRAVGRGRGRAAGRSAR